MFAGLRQNNALILYMNIDGKGNFGSKIEIDRHETSPASILAVDFDGDSDQDIVIATSVYNVTEGKIFCYENLCCQCFFRVDVR